MPGRNLHSYVCGSLLIAFTYAIVPACAADFHPPAGEAYPQVRGDIVILPGGRALKPLGTQIDAGPGAFGIAVSPKGVVAIANTGFERSGLSIIHPGKGAWNEEQIWAAGADEEPKTPKQAQQMWRGGSFGLAFDEGSVWVSEGESGRVRLVNTSGDTRRVVNLNDATWQSSYTGSLVFDPLKHLLYAADQTNARVAIVDSFKSTVVGSIKTEALPFAIALSPDRKTLWIAGQDRVQAADLGTRDAKPLISIPVATPAAILPVDGLVYVSDERNDSVVVISAAEHKVIKTIPLRIPWLPELRGIVPGGMAFDAATKWLYVTEAGINAVGVIDTERDVVIAHLPVGWYPTSVAISEGRAWVVNALGKGTGSNARRATTYSPSPLPTTFYRGTVSSFPLPAKADLQNLTATAFAANGFFRDDKTTPVFPSAIHHVVLIAKGSRGFDEIFGDISRPTGGPIFGTPELARFGMHGHADGEGAAFSIKDVAVTPNHHALATQFALSDNFYAAGDTPLEGNHWLSGVIPNLITMSGIFDAYTVQNAVMPNRITPKLPHQIYDGGTLWNQLAQHSVSFLNFGAEQDAAPSGTSDPDYPPIRSDASDQLRADRFIAELQRRYADGKEQLPQFLFISLPDDRDRNADAASGHPYAASWVADNDLALGRVVDYLSHSPWWRDMAIFVTEESTLGGLDSIDSHRTVFLAAGPYVKHNYVLHTNASAPGLVKTILSLLHVPPLNLLDAAAQGLHDLFTDQPDYTPYTAISSDVRIFDPKPR